MICGVVIAAFIALILTAACNGGSTPQEPKVVGDELQELTVVGACDLGMKLQAWQGCEIGHYDSTETLWVKPDGSGCITTKEFRALPTTTPVLHQRFDYGSYTSTTECRNSFLTLNNSRYGARLSSIDADKNEDGSWTVVRFSVVIQ